MTSLKNNPLSRIADVVLYSVGDDDGVRSSAISARDAQLALTDLLFILLVQRQPDANEHIRDSEMAVSALKQDAS